MEEKTSRVFLEDSIPANRSWLSSLSGHRRSCFCYCNLEKS